MKISFSLPSKILNSGSICKLFTASINESMKPVILINSNNAKTVAKAIVREVGSENMLANASALAYRNTV
jgi:hypothetical protein